MPTLDPATPPAVPAGYQPVPLAALDYRRDTAIDLFVLPAGKKAPILLRDSGLQLSDARTKRLLDGYEQQVLVRTGDFAAFSQAMLTEIDALVADEAVPAHDRFALLQFAAASEVEQAFERVDPGHAIDLAGGVSSSIVSLVSSAELSPDELYNIARHDYHTFVHVTNVTCYATLLAEALGVNDQADLHELAMGAFLHDIGKRQVPRDILRKPARLTDEERAVIQTHPQLGYEELAGRPEVTGRQLMMVYQHHEWVDGGGYPVGVLADELHEWAQLLAVVDVFDAMTGQRPYRKPSAPDFVMSFLDERAGSQFNPEMVRCWTQLLAGT
ncbi:MAG: HD domain-containing phosphohydrolase [Planctomycetota bacterium]